MRILLNPECTLPHILKKTTLWVYVHVCFFYPSREACTLMIGGPHDFSSTPSCPARRRKANTCLRSLSRVALPDGARVVVGTSRSPLSQPGALRMRRLCHSLWTVTRLCSETCLKRLVLGRRMGGRSLNCIDGSCKSALLMRVCGTSLRTVAWICKGHVHFGLFHARTYCKTMRILGYLSRYRTTRSTS